MSEVHKAHSDVFDKPNGQCLTSIAQFRLPMARKDVRKVTLSQYAFKRIQRHLQYNHSPLSWAERIILA